MKRHGLLRIRTSWVAGVGYVPLALLALALVWYGAMTIALAAGVAPHTVDSLSAYRTIYDHLAGLRDSAITSRVRLVAGLAGAATFALAAWVAWKALPRPHRPRRDLVLEQRPGAQVVVLPRAIERAAESAASEHRAVAQSSCVYAGDELDVEVSLRQTGDVAEALRDVQRRVVSTLAQHELPAVPVSVTLTGFEPSS